MGIGLPAKRIRAKSTFVRILGGGNDCGYIYGMEVYPRAVPDPKATGLNILSGIP